MQSAPYSNDQIYEYAKTNNIVPSLSAGTQIPIVTTFITPPVNGYPVTPIVYPVYPPAYPPLATQQKMIAAEKGYFNGVASAFAVCCCLQLLCCLL